MKTIYDYKETEMSGKTIDLSAFKNKVLVIVNTASKCGLAPQLEGLENCIKVQGRRPGHFGPAFQPISSRVGYR